MIKLNHYDPWCRIVSWIHLDGCNRSIGGEESKAIANLEEVNMLVSKASILKGGYLIRIIALAAESLPPISTYLVTLVDHF